MKNLKKLASLVLALVMVFSLATTAFAAGETGTITITNAAKGETYKAIKLFDAQVSEDGTHITYTGTIPEALNEIFETNASGNIVKKDGVSDEELITAVQAWAAEQTSATATAVGEGGPVVMTVSYGYYAVTTTQGAVVSVDSTTPNAEIVDKNGGTPTLSKKVDDSDVFIGQKVTYTVEFDAYNYHGEGEDAELVTEYYITDTRAQEFLDEITVTSINIQEDPNDKDKDSDKEETALTVQQFDKDGKIMIDWATKSTVDEKDVWTSNYANGSKIIITYTGVVTKDAAIDGNGNTNTVTLSWNTVDNEYPDQQTKTVTIYTYAIAVKKVDQDGNALSGATFEFPFYVKAEPDTDGAYIYAGTTAGDGLVNEITTEDDAVIIVKGVAAGDYSIEETSAPAGYNKMPTATTVTAKKTGETTTTEKWYIDADGNITETSSETTTEVTLNIGNISAEAILVINKAGAELPSTGGIGTTMFYVFGAIMVIGAAVLLVTKKRMGEAQ